MLTVESLTSELGLKLVAGADQAAEREIRWVHISELLDPTPWLSGGDRQSELVRLLAGREVAGLGFGTGFNHAKLPKAVVKEAGEWGLPLFEVPYKMPFIQITEVAANHLVNEQYDVLSRGIAVNERLERLVLEGGGLDEIAREIAAAVGGSSVVLDARGEPLAHGGRRLGAEISEAIRNEVQSRGSAAAPFVPVQADLRGRTLAHPVLGPVRAGRIEALVCALADDERACDVLRDELLQPIH